MLAQAGPVEALSDPAHTGAGEIEQLIEARRYQDAEALLRDRLKAHAAEATMSTAEAASDGEQLAFLLSMTKRAEEAEPFIRAAVQTREALGDDRQTGRSLNRLAAVLLARRSFDEAEACARRAIAMLANSARADDRLVAAWGNLGRILEARERLPEAVVAYAQGMTAGRAMLGDNDPTVAALAGLRADAEALLSSYRARTAEQRRLVEALTDAKGRSDEETGRALYLLSLFLVREGRIDEAGSTAEEAYEILTRTLGPEHRDTRSSLYQLATMLRRLAEARADAEAPPVVETGGGLSAWSDDDIRRLIDRRMFAAAEAAVRARTARYKKGAQSSDAASDLELLAHIYYLTGRADSAEVLMRNAVVLRKRLGDAAAYSSALRRLALVLSARGRYAAGEVEARRAIAAAARLGGETRSLAAAWGTLGELLAGQRRRPEASAAMQKAIDLGKAALGDDDMFVVEEYNGFALNLEEMGDVAAAETIYRRNLQILSRIKGAAGFETARTLALLSTNLDRQGRMLEAEVRLRQAIALRERHLGPGNPDTLRSYGNLVGLLTKDSKFGEAAALQARVTALRAALPERNFEESIADLGRMGSILTKQGKIDAAIAYQRQALALAGETLDPGHPYVQIASMELARSIARGDPASREYVELMRSAVGRARGERRRILSAADVSRANGSDHAVAAAVSDDGWSDRSTAGVFQLALSLYANHATAVRSEEAALRAESFLIAQDSASSAATRALAGIIVREGLGDTALGRLARRQQDLAARIRELNRSLGLAMIGAADAAAEVKERIGAAGRELTAVEARLLRAYPDYARLAAPQALSEDAVRRRLKPGEALLLVTEGDQYNFTYVVTPDGAAWDAVPRMQSNLPGTIAAFRCEVDPQTCSGDQTASALFDRRYAWDLYRFLLQPHEALLSGVKTLYVTTSGPLADLPFAAFITAEPEGEDTEAALAATPWLGDRFAIVNLPSIELLRMPGKKPPERRARPFVGYGAPVLATAGTKRDVTTGLSPQARPTGPALADPARLRALRSLPGTEVELSAMARALGADIAAIHLGPDATEAAVRADARLRDARIVAFATHGVLPGEIEGFAEPGLIFTPPERATAADDGILTAAEAAGLDLSAEWVILSACNTGTTDGYGGGEALSGLARSFLYAGADALLASRWRVGDEVTAALTVETLVNAMQRPRAGKAAALQAAMRAIRTGKRSDGSAVAGWTADWAHPAAWAPFSLIATAD